MRIIYSKTTYRNVVYRALVAVIAGVILIIWPDQALRYIVMFLGAIFLVTGVMAFITSYRNSRAEQGGNGLLSLNGVGSTVLGILLLSLPFVFTSILMFMLGLMLVFAAIAQLTTLSAARQLGYSSPISYLFPILILLAGIVVIFKPWGSATYVVIILGITAIFYGLTDLISQYNINKLRKKFDKQEQEKKMDGDGKIEDVDYEEVK